MKKIFENTQTRLKKVIYGKEPTVYSFAIITSENPMGQTLTKKMNYDRHENFKDALNSNMQKFIVAKGKYNALENPFIILNINREEVKQYGYRYDQESFIFAENDEQIQKVIFEYWEKTKTGVYNLQDIEDHIKTLDVNIQDSFTNRKTWKFNIPFSYFEAIDQKIYDLYGKLLEKQIKEINEINKHIALSEKLTLKHYYIQRGHINYVIHKKYNKEWYEKKKAYLKSKKENKNWIKKLGFK